mgnify:CR=1 FL=1
MPLSDRDQKIIDLAIEQCLFTDGETELGNEGDTAMVSEGDDNGAYVRAWVWVSFAGTDLDKETGEKEEH